jgi:hypothetical protein
METGDRSVAPADELPAITTAKSMTAKATCFGFMAEGYLRY